MGRRMSNRDRIDRMREEAAATEREKEKRRAERASRPGASAKADTDVRLKLVWAVKDPGGEVLCTYPYPRKDLAEAEAQRRRVSDGRSYIVTPEKVPFDA